MSEAPRRSTRLNKGQEEDAKKTKPVDHDVEMDESTDATKDGDKKPEEKVLGVKELEAIAIAGKWKQNTLGHSSASFSSSGVMD